MIQEQEKTLEISENKFVRFLRDYCWDNILYCLNRYPDTKSVFIDYRKLDSPKYQLADFLENEPYEFIRMFQDAVSSDDMAFPVDVDSDLSDLEPRVTGFPFRTNISGLRSDHLTKYVSMEGIVKKVSKARPMITNAAFYCMRCEHITYIPQTGNKFTQPHECENETCGRKGPFKSLVDKSSFRNVEIIELQENPENIQKRQPESIICYAYDDMIKQMAPGDKVVINGILQSRQIESRDGKKPFFEYILDVNNVEKLEQDFDDIEITPEEEEKILELSQDPNIKDKISQSIATSIHGYDTLKKAMALQQFSGLPKYHDDGSFSRGDIHILVVSDPGMGKSKLLKYGKELSPKGVIASGESSSGAGLTATVLKEDPNMDSQFTLEAGALPLADRGLCCIDELDKMKATDRRSLHDAMAQQVLNVHKANIHITLLSRAAVLGAANPKYGRFDRYESLTDQINLSPSLVSRFDLIFLMVDVPEPRKDMKLGYHIINSHIISSAKQNGSREQYNTIKSIVRVPTTESAIDFDLLKKYIAYARSRCNPVIPAELNQKINDFWMKMRSASDEKSIPITARKLESVIRLAEASARMRLSDQVNEQDVADSIDILIFSLKQTAIDPDTGEYDADVIETGNTRSQREKIKALKSMVQQLEECGEGRGAELEDLYLEAEKDGIPKDQAEQLVKRMKKQGDILSLGNNHVTAR